MEVGKNARAIQIRKRQKALAPIYKNKNDKETLRKHREQSPKTRTTLRTPNQEQTKQNKRVQGGNQTTTMKNIQETEKRENKKRKGNKQRERTRKQEPD